MKVLLAGDSTVAACPAVETPMSGWGAHVGAALNSRLAADDAFRPRPPTVPVVNVAKGGATTASHRAEGLWDALMTQLASGDVVVVQFGHNDQKHADLDPHGQFRDNLEHFADESLGAGAQPVLCTPVARRMWDGSALVDTHGEYPAAVRKLAADRDLPLIDLTEATSALYRRLGPGGSAALFTHVEPGVSRLYPDGIQDNTHFRVEGACLVAEMVAEGLRSVVRSALQSSRSVPH